MFQSLYIQNFILIEKLELDFSKGFCVITGETGAGKSILLDAILFCFGQKIAGNPIGPFLDSCSVGLEIICNNSTNQYLEELGVEHSSNLIVKCNQNKQGRKKFFLNDQLVTAKLIQGLFNCLVELHGQHNHTILLDKSVHIDILDEFGKLNQIRDKLSKQYRLWQSLERQKVHFTDSKEQTEQEIDYLQHVCLELKKAEIKPSEEQKLVDIKNKLRSTEKEQELVKNLLLDLEDSAIERLVLKAQKSINTCHNSQLEMVSNNLEAAYDSIEDAKSNLQSILSNIEYSDIPLPEIEDRLYEIRTLARKHSCPSDELDICLKKYSKQLENLLKQTQDNAELEQKICTSQKEYFSLAQELSLHRQSSAALLSQKVMDELAMLEMQKAIFTIEVDAKDEFASAAGIDKISFLAATNPGIASSEINKIASGGELSRFMLALRVALFDRAPKQSIIFDEIDVGISGAVADAIGERLKTLSKALQIIVVTHQPQVAGKAEQHILVTKTQHELHTTVNVLTLDQNASAYELARMISGKEITQAGLKAAKELLI